MLFDTAFIVVLILLNAFFVASEISLVAARKSRLASLINKKSITSRALQSNAKDINLFITAMQVANTLINIAIGWRGQVLVHKIFPYNNIFTTVLPFLLITGTLMIFGELIPKKMAVRNPERYAFIFAIPTALYSYVFEPAITFVDKLTEFLLKPLGLDGEKIETPISEKELRIIIHQSVKDGVIPPNLQSLVFNSLRLKNIKSRNVMHSHSSIVSFPTHATIKQIQHEIARRKHHFLRYIVHHKTKKNIVGFIEASDLLITGVKNKDLTLKDAKIIKRAILASHESSLDEILSHMLANQIFVAIIQEDKKPIGIVTINTITKELTKRFD